MANDVERVPVGDKKDALPEELSAFDELVLTDTDRLYGYEQGKRKQVGKLGHLVIALSAQVTGHEIETLAPGRGAAGRRPERLQPTSADIEAMIQRAVAEALQQAQTASQEREQQLQEQIDKLQKEIERLQKPLDVRLDEAFGTTWVPRDKEIMVARRAENGYLDEGWATDGQPYEKDGKWYIRIKKDATVEEAELASLMRVPETPPPVDETAQRQQQREELEARIANYEGVNLDNLYQTYRGHLQHVANTDERQAFANDATREAAMAQVRSQQVRAYIDSMNEQQRNALPASAARDLITWLEIRDAQEPAITPAAEQRDTQGAPVGRRRVEVRRSLYDRLRRRPARQYYMDENSDYYYVNDANEPIYVPNEVIERDNNTAAGIAVGAVAVGATALITWLLTRHGGPDVSSLKIQENKHHLAEMNAIATAKKQELKALSAHDAHMTREIWHSHKHDQQIFNGIQNRIDRTEARELRGIGSLHNRLQDSGVYWGARYPWDWAANKVGSFRAEGWLHNLAGRAAKHGHKIVWLHNNGKEILQVDGTTNTSKVLGILSQYK